MIPKNRELFSNLSDIEHLFFDDEAYPWEALLKMVSFMYSCVGDRDKTPPLPPCWPPALRCIRDEKREDSTPPNFMAIEREAQVRGGSELCSDQDVHVKGPVIFGRDVTLRKGAVITGPSYIGDGVIIGQGCRVKNSILLRGAEIEFGTRVAHSIIGSGAYIGQGARLCDRPLRGGVVEYDRDVSTNMTRFGLVTGDRCMVGGGAIFVPGVILLQGTTVLEGVRLRRRTVYGGTVQDEVHDQ